VVIAALVTLSVILTASVLFPAITGAQIIGVLMGGGILAAAVALGANAWQRAKRLPPPVIVRYDPQLRNAWRMPPLDSLRPARLTIANRVWLIVLRAYLALAAALLIAKLVQLAVAAAPGA
jgi:hypothetical protein